LNLKLSQKREVFTIVELSIKNNIECELHIVGEGGTQTEMILENIKAYPDLFKYHGRIAQKEELIRIYRDCHLFVMPSRNETFGLVYVEAMLQGLPILYTDTHLSKIKDKEA